LRKEDCFKKVYVGRLAVQQTVAQEHQPKRVSVGALAKLNRDRRDHYGRESDHKREQPPLCFTS
jgi:hypothetical protein